MELPTEIITQIVEFLSKEDLKWFAYSSKRYYNIADRYRWFIVKNEKDIEQYRYKYNNRQY